MITSSLLGKHYETQYPLKMYGRMKAVLEFRHLNFNIQSYNFEDTLISFFQLCCLISIPSVYLIKIDDVIKTTKLSLV